MAREEQPVDRRIAIAVAATLLLLAGVFVSAAAYETGRGALDGAFQDRPLHRDSALLAVAATREGERPHASDLKARFTLLADGTVIATKGNRAHPMVHFEVPDGTYTLKVETRNATGLIDLQLDHMTRVIAIQHPDGSMSFRIDDSHHGPPHRPFDHRPPRDHDGARPHGPGHAHDGHRDTDTFRPNA